MRAGPDNGHAQMAMRELSASREQDHAKTPAAVLRHQPAADFTRFPVR